MLVLIALIVGGFLWWRSRGKRTRGLSLSTHEEHIPLNSSMADEANGSREDGFRPRKGKERAGSVSEEEEEAIFDVGDDDDDERSPRPRS